MNDRITAMEERVAFAMWEAEADRAAPNVGRNRTADMFAEASADERARWLSLARAALAASRAAPDCHQPDLVTAAQVRIKPLVWGESYGVFRAETPLGDYKITGRILRLPTGAEQVHVDIEAAKAAAQADYEARIIAALDLTPAPAVESVAMTAQDAARVPEIAGQIREITEADMANIVAHLSYECEPTGPLPNANSLMMEVVRLRNKLAALRAIGGDA